MSAESFFLRALVYLGSAVLLVPVAKRLGVGSVLGYLLAGVLIGPFGLDLVGGGGKDVLHFAEFGVVLMLFVIGLELEPRRVWRMRGPILGLGGLQVVATAALVTAVARRFELPWGTALALGMTLALSSTAIVLQTLHEKGLMRTAGGQSAFAVLLFQDIAVIPMLAAMPLLARFGATGAVAAGTEPAHGTWLEGLPGWARMIAVPAAVLVVVLGGRFVVRPVLRWVARSRLAEMSTATALLLVIGIAELMALVGLSPALGTFLAGVVLATSEYRHQLESDIEPFKGLLLGLFFISVGTSIDFGLIGAQLLPVAGLLVALVLGKLVVLVVLGRVFGLGTDQNLLMSFSLAQGGEFAFVLVSYGLRSGVFDEDLAGRTVAVVALSMALTPLVMLANERLLAPRTGTSRLPPREPDVEDDESPVVIAGFGQFGQVVGRFLRANGVRATVLETDSDRVDLLRRLGLEVYYGNATRPELLAAAGADRARLLVIALSDEDKALELVRIARERFPGLEILARASTREAAYRLLDAGVEHVYRDTLDSSLRTGADALRALGHRAYAAHRAAQTFRRHDEAALRELARMRHDREGYIDLARRRIADLEELLLADRREPDGSRDAGWDTEGLRRELGSGEEDAADPRPGDASEPPDGISPPAGG